jgi:hypothetical protein
MLQTVTTESLINKSYDYITKESVKLGYLPPLNILLDRLAIKNKSSVALFTAVYKEMENYLNN